MNILHITSILPAPIAEKKRENDILLRIAKEYVKKYPDDAHEFIFLVPYSNATTAKLSDKWRGYYQLLKKGRFELDGFEINVVAVPGHKYDRGLRWFYALLGCWMGRERISKILARARPDIIHAHNMSHNMYLAERIRRRYGVNFLVTARNAELSSFNEINRKRINPSRIIAHSQLTARKCKQYVDVPVNLIPHPVDEDFYIDKSDISDDVSDVVRMVSICNLIPLKNIHNVIDALEQVDSKFTYTIFGDGPEKSRLVARAKAVNGGQSIIFQGYVNHESLPVELRRCDLFLMPSFPETLGRAFFEAMASGVPVVAAKGTGIDGMIENHVHGYLVEHDNVNDIKDAIGHYLSLSSDQRLEMKYKAAEFAQQYTWEQVLSDYRTVYHG